jgi:hypothetical protein
MSRADAARLVVIPALTAGIVYMLCIGPARHPAADAGGLGRVALVQKDASWHPIPRRPGAPSGGVWYTTRGSAFRFGLRAGGLDPGTRYIVELEVDGTSLATANHAATPAGEVSLDTTLSAFADGPCSGSHHVATRSLAGTHRVKFLLKRNGNPPGAAAANGASCAGNGDGNFSYVLFEEKLAIYDGDR